MADLRPSQVETLRELDALEGEATVAELAVRLDRSERSTEQRLDRLGERALVGHPFRGPSWDPRYFFGLTPKGYAALAATKKGGQ
jgi:Mn-dependent DtxR family transcriptional regulator